MRWLSVLKRIVQLSGSPISRLLRRSQVRRMALFSRSTKPGAGRIFSGGMIVTP